MKKFIILTIMVFGLLSMSCQAPSAAPLTNIWDGWTQFADDDGYSSNGYVNPGWGGQYFDAEYLYYKYDGTQLSIGLQTGFDLDDGIQSVSDYDGTGYYGGDLALSFDGDSTTFEYGIDFGFNPQYDYYSHDLSGLSAGLYSVNTWNNGIYFSTLSSPFAIDSASSSYSTIANSNFSQIHGQGIVDNEVSYFRQVSFDISSITAINPEQVFTLGAHWTMSCGNDVVEGEVNVAPVPEPATIFLMLSGLLGLVGVRRRCG